MTQAKIRTFQIFCTFIFLLNFLPAFSQITGSITDSSNEPLPYVNIYTEDGRFGTTSNEDGKFELKISQTGNYELVFQFLGYETLRKKINITTFPYVLNVSLSTSTTSLDEVTVRSNENPANKIIQQAIDHRKENAGKIDEYTSDYYSRGLWRMNNVPEKILGQEVGDLGGSLDSTRSGIIYLSETISQIKFKAPSNFQEKILASKVSGNDNGFSLNSAQESNFSFYNNTLNINAELVSPIADYAFSYYDYKLEGIFYDDAGNLINKIQIIPKRPKDRVFYGTIYIVDNSWQIYGVELKTTGEAIQFTPIETLTFTQNFKYSEENDFWIKISQTVDFSFAMFGVTGDGRFTAVYSNYNFKPDFSKNSFGREILSFANEANKKDSLFWQEKRPVPLTLEETTDYVKKDSIQILRSSQKYLDSVDAVSNKFSLSNILFGYNYSESYKKQFFNISSPLLGTNFNTVQGWNPSVNFSFRKEQEENYSKFWSVSATTTYGFDDDRLRVKGEFRKKFNNISRPLLIISAGNEASQINDVQPISERLNTVTTLFFEKNYLKLYDRTFAKIEYQNELFNGFRLSSDFSFEQRNPLYNTTDQTLFNRDDVEYTANNPLTNLLKFAPFAGHHIFKFNISARVDFDQDYMSYPNMKLTQSSTKFPTLFVGYESGFGSNYDNYNFQEIKAMLVQNINLKNKGSFSYNLRAGKFLNSEKINILDYQHFNGNETRIGTGSYLYKFNLLPYYKFSTNKSYFEAHVEQDFKGWVLGKIPVINKLNYNLVLGGKILATEDRQPYFEYSAGIDNIGFGKYRLLRLDYAISRYNGKTEGAFIFGLKFLNILENL